MSTAASAGWEAMAATVGAKPLLVLTGKGETTQAEGKLPAGTLTFPDLAAAVEHSLSAP